MQQTSLVNQSNRSRMLHFLANPQLWQHWPFLPVVRRRPGCGEELGVVCDALHALGVPGHSCTVFLTNLFLLPPTAAEFLALPAEVFDTPEELADAGWLVD